MILSAMKASSSMTPWPEATIAPVVSPKARDTTMIGGVMLVECCSFALGLTELRPPARLLLCSRSGNACIQGAGEKNVESNYGVQGFTSGRFAARCKNYVSYPYTHLHHLQNQNIRKVTRKRQIYQMSPKTAKSDQGHQS